MTSTVQRRTRTGNRSRSAQLDRLRGVAILLMVVDHLALMLGPVVDLSDVRLTLGRAAMPIFFVLAGHLARDVHWRHLRVGLLGIGLPLIFQWLDEPNVLLWWAVGVAVLALLRRLRVPVWLLAVIGLTYGANGFGQHGGSYEYHALFGLMALGAMIPRDALERVGAGLPGWLEPFGRRPVLLYVVQAAVLTAVGVGTGALVVAR